jgi:hypothetical protein
MGHTQTTQSNNNLPYVSVRARIYFFLLSRHGHGHGHVLVYARLRHIKRTMQEPELPSDYKVSPRISTKTSQRSWS